MTNCTRTLNRLFLAITCVSFVTSCDFVSQNELKSSPLSGTTWSTLNNQIKSRNNKTPQTFTITFQPDGSVAGTKLCNTISAKGKWLPNGKLKNMDQSDAVTTLVDCQSGLQEEATADKFWSEIGMSNRWRLKKDVLILELKNNKNIILTRSEKVL